MGRSKEQWKEVESSDGYMISSLGRLRNKDGRIVKPKDDGQGYLRVNIGNGIRNRIHRLVAEAFVQNPDNKPQVDHINNDKKDNRAINLQWVTSQENTAKAGQDNILKKQKRTSPEIIAISLDFTNIYRFASQKEAGQKLGISSKDINKCLNGHRKTSHGYYWKYAEDVNVCVGECMESVEGV